jgi:hypothetical protein
MGRFTKVAQDAFDALQLDAGVILVNFDPASPAEPQSDDILAVTTGGINIVCTPTFSDFGEDVDNVPNNMMEFKHLDGWECTMSFSDLKFNANNTKFALGAADVTNATGYKKIVPRRDVKLTDFTDAIWWVGDKADGGAYAVCLLNALSTGGVSIQTSKNGKGTNAATLMGHVSINDQDAMPMEFYVIDAASGSATVTYTAVSPVGTENPSEEGGYVLSGNRYILASDTTVDTNKTYYEVSSST